MERYVAIDNVCAWPNLTRLPGQSIVAMIFNCSWVEQHNRYHMGVIRWRPDELNFV